MSGSGTAVGVKLADNLVMFPPKEADPPKLELPKLPDTTALVKLNVGLFALVVLENNEARHTTSR